ncbi:hypothetical protein [Neorhizobium sp. T25_27]|uniref:hypothetical protein n=1 Tax=Neorhizobium sp. T25_27 TaxID=2093831 RepID=UPI000CF9AAAB|nr:hypothetical protein [Neorhizobium sp. T25_27]
MANKEIPELTAASALEGDELVHVVQDGNSRKTTVDGIVDGAFRTTAMWSDVQVASASFKIFNAAGTPRALTFNTTALTADRAATWPDANVDLGDIVKAWVNFNGTGTLAVRSSKNILGVTDNGVGQYAPVFTSAAPHANYGVVGSCRIPASSGLAGASCTPFSTYSGSHSDVAPTTAGFVVKTYTQGANNQIDADFVMLMVIW